MGRVIARDLSANSEVLVADTDPVSLSSLKGISTFKGSYRKIPGLGNADLVVAALPSEAGHDAVKFLLEQGRNVVDISFTDYDPFEFDSLAKENGCLYIPHAGFAPGLSNILAGNLYYGHGSRDIEILVAGLQEKPMPPMGYIPTFNASSVIDEYTRPARYILKGSVRDARPLDTIEPIKLEGFGNLESFYSDGLSTILNTFKEGSIVEKTLRYPGHMEKMKFLNDMGYFSSEKAGNCSPREISDELFRRTVKDVPDVSILKVKARDGKGPEFSIIDRFDSRSGISSMGRMTGFSAAAMAMAVMESRIRGTGTFPAEWAGRNPEAFRFILEYLEKRSVQIKIGNRPT